MSKAPKGLVNQQQLVVNEIVAMVKRLELLTDGPALTPGIVKHWFHKQPFAEGQLSVMFENATLNLRNIVSAFEDCAEEGVDVEDLG